MTPHPRRWALVAAGVVLAAACLVAWLLTRPPEIVYAPKSYDDLAELSGAEEPGADVGSVPETAAPPTLQGSASTDPQILRGTIVDDRTGAPIPGVQVVAFAPWDAPHQHIATTREDGDFDLPLPVDSYLLTTWHESYVPAALTKWLRPQRGFQTSRFHEAYVEAQQVLPDPWDLRLRPGTRLRARVVDTSGAVVAGAYVRLRGSGSSMLQDALPASLRARTPGMKPAGANDDAEVLCDERGVLDVSVLPSPLESWWIAGGAPGHAGAWQALAQDGPWDLTLTVVRGSEVRGRVVDEDGRPVAGVWVGPGSVADDERWTFDTSVAPVLSDAEGRFSLQSLTPTDVTLVAVYEDPSALAGHLVVPRLTAGEIRTALEVHVRARHVLRATLVDAEGRSVPDVPLRVLEPAQADADAGGVATTTESAHTDERGHVGLEMDHAGPWTIQLSTPLGWSTLADRIQLPAPEVKLVAPSASITSFRLELVDTDLTPVPWFRVLAFSLAGDSLRARRDHAFTATNEGRGMQLNVPGPPPIALCLDARRGEDLKRDGMLHVVRDVPADGTLWLVWSDDTGLTGDVRDTEGHPVEGATIRIGPKLGTPDSKRWARSDTEGRFVVPFVPDHPHVVDVVVTPPAGFAAGPPIRHDIFAGPLHVVLDRGSTLAGRIVADADVAFNKEDRVAVHWFVGEDRSELRGHASATVQPDGRFVVEGVPDDQDLLWSYRGPTLERHGLLLEAVPSPVRAGANLVVRATTALQLHGRVVGAKDPGSLLLRVRPSGELHDVAQMQPDPTGEFHLERLRPGHYDVLVVSGPGSRIPLAQTRVEAGHDNVEIQVPELGLLLVRVTPPLPNVSCWIRDTEGSAPADKGLTNQDGECRFRVVRGRTYSVSATGSRDSKDRLHVAGHVPLAPADTVAHVTLVDALLLRCMVGDRSLDDLQDLRARQGAAVYPLVIVRRPSAFAFVEPGLYDILGTDANGDEHVLARGVEAGGEDVVLAGENR